MRLYLKLTRNNELIPFNYQPFITGAIHKWIGERNSVHDRMSHYSFSWLQNVETRAGDGLDLTSNSYFFISAYDNALIKTILKGILAEPGVCFGVTVSDVQIVEEPRFTNRQVFQAASPIFIKRRFDNKEKHITYDDEKSGYYLTETLQKKLKDAGHSPDGVKVFFDTSYPAPRTKVIHYKAVGNRANICPVVIEGTPEQIAFAWNVGVGNSTGIGFGALK